jgi:UDP-N-acetylglucosamine--N-acetylmuramyl-(pentapeptide) pyrophosphoryl-undecaprenol N-acetylglucosamine transferase
MKIAITGGHLTPALAFIEYVQKTAPKVEFIFIGREFSQSNKSQKAREAIEVAAFKVPFADLDVPRFTHRNPLNVLIDAVRYPFSIAQALQLVMRHRPTILVSFGGYLAVPVAIACWLTRIPVITHEQTVVGGSANQFIAKFSKYVALSFPESKKYFAGSKTKVVGNPIRNSLFGSSPERPNWIATQPTKPILFVTGGNQGSYFINTTIGHILPQLTRKYVVIHACGTSTTQLNYKAELQSITKKLSANQQHNYYVRDWISQDELAWILQHTALAVSRSGANTVQELILNQIPAIFVPLPFAKNDEQHRNAQMVVKTGGAEIIAQNNLTPELLLETINKKMAIHKALKAKIATISLPTDGAAKLFNLVESVSNPQ